MRAIWGSGYESTGLGVREALLRRSYGAWPGGTEPLGCEYLRLAITSRIIHTEL